MRILGAFRDNSAFDYRVRFPFMVLDRMTEHDWKAGRVPINDSDGYDVLWMQQHAEAEAIIVAQEWKSKGHKVVYDVDDFLIEIPPSWVGFADWRDSNREFYHRQLMTLADIVTTTTPYLAEKLRGVLGSEKPTHVLPNCILRSSWDTLPPIGHNLAAIEKPDGPVLGWFGTASHWDDWLEIAPAVERAIAGSGAWLAIIGAPEVTRCFSPELLERTLIQPPVKHDVLCELIKAFDIGLAWATDRTEASKCRSPLKLYQYGAAGIPVVASRTVYGDDKPARRDGVRIIADGVRIVADVDWLADAISDALRNMDEFKAEAEKLRQYVWYYHSYEECYQPWLDVLEALG